MTGSLTTKLSGSVAIFKIENPPVNALSHVIRKALWQALEQAESDSDITSIVIVSTGRLFSAGADIKEFDALSLNQVFPPL